MQYALFRSFGFNIRGSAGDSLIDQATDQPSTSWKVSIFEEIKKLSGRDRETKHIS